MNRRLLNSWYQLSKCCGDSLRCWKIRLLCWSSTCNILQFCRVEWWVVCPIIGNVCSFLKLSHIGDIVYKQGCVKIHVLGHLSSLWVDIPLCRSRQPQVLWSALCVVYRPAGVCLTQWSRPSRSVKRPWFNIDTNYGWGWVRVRMLVVYRCVHNQYVQLGVIRNSLNVIPTAVRRTDLPIELVVLSSGSRICIQYMYHRWYVNRHDGRHN